MQNSLNLEGIEKFLGQKIPVTWAEDDLFAEEIKPTAEERRRYAEEREPARRIADGRRRFEAGFERQVGGS